LANLPAKTTVDLETLITRKIVDQDDAKKFGVKILGDGEIKVPLVVKLPTSGTAAKKIEAAGGKVE